MIDMPQLGFGTAPLVEVDWTALTAEAIDVGYRHIDTAQMYDNEAAVGAGIRASGVSRDELYVVTKIHQDRFLDGTALDSARRSVDALGAPADLILVHWPPRGLETEAVIDVMLEVQAQGLTREIGVSNFNRPQLRAAAGRAKILTNQVEFHTLINQFDLLETARGLGITLTAYTPILRGIVLEEPEVQAIATRLEATPAQVALAWVLCHGVAALCLSTKRARLAENLAAGSLTLPPEDIARLDTLARTRNARHTRSEAWEPEWDAP
ncbi:MAG: aldo/keto reductase [Pseudomonadota bacterium]